jgi:hypothetical protein
VSDEKNSLLFGYCRGAALGVRLLQRRFKRLLPPWRESRGLNHGRPRLEGLGSQPRHGHKRPGAYAYPVGKGGDPPISQRQLWRCGQVREPAPELCLFPAGKGSRPALKVGSSSAGKAARPARRRNKGQPSPTRIKKTISRVMTACLRFTMGRRRPLAAAPDNGSTGGHRMGQLPIVSGRWQVG